MLLRVLTLPFDPDRRRFDDDELVRLQAEEGRCVQEYSLLPVEAAGGLCLVCTLRLAGASPVPLGQRASEQEAVTVSPVAAGPRETGELDAKGTELLERIRAWRRKAASDEGVPAYVILTNRQAREIARLRPASCAALQRIHGIGPKKVARHGEAILGRVRGARPRLLLLPDSSPVRGHLGSVVTRGSPACVASGPDSPASLPGPISA